MVRALNRTAGGVNSIPIRASVIVLLRYEIYERPLHIVRDIPNSRLVISWFGIFGLICAVS